QTEALLEDVVFGSKQHTCELSAVVFIRSILQLTVHVCWWMLPPCLVASGSPFSTTVHYSTSSAPAIACPLSSTQEDSSARIPTLNPLLNSPPESQPRLSNPEQ
ncbi:hypothetical protein ATANTOWER_029223, partial [Ataeniobius toweri]|nr:hypothetical protein [Ataeniobius toweri]